MPRIAIVTGAHLCRNPRVVKEADALTAAGYEVTVLGPVLSPEIDEIDRVLLASRPWRREVTVDLSTLPGYLDRVRRRAGMETVRRVGHQSPDALGYGLRVALRKAVSLQPDLVIGHQEVGLWVASRMRRRGFTAGVDFEDWYSRDLLPEARVGRPVALLEDLEREMLSHGDPVFTTSDAMGAAMAAALGGRCPVTIYNAFPWADRDTIDGRSVDRSDRGRRALYWVSQTVGPGRGLDLLLRALARVKTPLDVHVRGSRSPETQLWLERTFPRSSGHRLYLHDLVPPGELLSRLTEHDIGLALEEASPPSRDLTITNKILHYLLGGLAVIATATQGQREVARLAPGAVRLLEAGTEEELATHIEELVESPTAMQRCRDAAVRAAEQVFCWERQESRLVAAVSEVIGHA